VPLQGAATWLHDPRANSHWPSLLKVSSL